MQLKYRIWLLLGALLAVVLVIDLTFSYHTLKSEIRAEMELDAKTIYGFMMATRRVYQQQFITSGLPVNDQTIGFLPAHSFSRISRDFAHWNTSGIIFNNVSDVPRNPGNQADRFEMESIAHFRTHPDETQRLSEIVTDQGVGYQLFTVPIRIEPFCLKCHGERDAAPPSIRERYAGAYGYKVGDLRGVVSIRIPTAKFEEQVWRMWGGQLIKTLVTYALIFIVLGLILDRLVLRRLRQLHTGAEQIADGEYDTRISLSEATEAGDALDEVGALAKTFNRMAEAVQIRDRNLVTFLQAVEQTPASILITNLNREIEFVNSAFTRSSGYLPEEVLGKNPRILQSGETPRETYLALWSALNHGKAWEGELSNRRKDGTIYTELAIIAPVRDSHGVVAHYLAVKQDITDKKLAAAEIHNLAFFDPLTALPNRRLLMDRLEQGLLTTRRSRQHGAVLMLDLDNFKGLNDTRGHAMGDLVLAAVAQRLSSSVRQEDTVSRLGGDEFVVILENLGLEMKVAALLAEQIAEKVRQALSEPYTLPGEDVPYITSASIGICLFHGDNDIRDALLKQADVALYQAKEAGRNQVRFFDQAMQAAIDARASMEAALRQALINQELHLYYQPQVNEEGSIVGAEALLRWRRTDGTFVSPSEFIPLAEESSLILPIGEWVFKTACAQLKTWSTNPRTQMLELAVNISGRQFLLPDFVPRIAACMDECGIDPRRLKLELTESVLLVNLEPVIQRMHELKAMGVRFSLDDFGTGYSSLSYLKRLPLDQVKIDQSFVRDIGRDANDDAIVRAIVAISASLDLKIIAEGVETEAQREFLRQNGCTAFQGYLFGKPMPIEDWPLVCPAY